MIVRDSNPATVPRMIQQSDALSVAPFPLPYYTLLLLLSLLLSLLLCFIIILKYYYDHCCSYLCLWCVSGASVVHGA